MNLSVTLWLMALGALLIVLPGLNLIGVALLALSSGNAVGRLAGPDKRYKELR